jgi:3-deoxy-7-phosphoheptulonate synthase
MLLILNPKATKIDAEQLMERLVWMKFKTFMTQENSHYSIAVIRDTHEKICYELFADLPFVDQVVPFKERFKLASRDFKQSSTVIDLGDIKIGDGSLTIMAGPCSVETEEQVYQAAAAVSSQGVKIFRGGAFKPRTSPHDFQGLGETGLRYLSKAAKAHNMLCISEVMDTREVELVAHYVDILQIGARNMQNFSLLKAVGALKKPVLLKRGMQATYSDFLMAAEYILMGGNMQVMLCERGIRTFEGYTRNTLDISAIPILQELSHLPVIVDPSHAVGIRRFVPPLAYAAVAAGADGLLVEVHPEPEKALCDGQESLTPSEFAKMSAQCLRLKEVFL